MEEDVTMAAEADDYDMTDEEFDRVMAEGEPVVLVDPPTSQSRVIIVGKGALRGVVFEHNHLVAPKAPTFEGNEVTV
jgi:hypothetical protein